MVNNEAMNDVLGRVTQERVLRATASRDRMIQARNADNKHLFRIYIKNDSAAIDSDSTSTTWTEHVGQRTLPPLDFDRKVFHLTVLSKDSLLPVFYSRGVRGDK